MKKQLSLIYTLLSVLMILFSCKKDEAEDPLPIHHPINGKVILRVINASNDVDSIDLYLNGNIIVSDVKRGTVDNGYKTFSYSDGTTFGVTENGMSSLLFNNTTNFYEFSTDTLYVYVYGDKNDLKTIMYDGFNSEINGGNLSLYCAPSSSYNLSLKVYTNSFYCNSATRLSGFDLIIDDTITISPQAGDFNVATYAALLNHKPNKIKINGAYKCGTKEMSCSNVFQISDLAPCNTKSYIFDCESTKLWIRLESVSPQYINFPL